MKNSIAFKIIGITTLIFILADSMLIYLSGSWSYQLVHDVYSSHVRSVSSFCADFLDTNVYDNDHPKVKDNYPILQQYQPEKDYLKVFQDAYAELLMGQCKANHLQYVYLIKPDLEAGTVTYLALASGDGEKGKIQDVSVGMVRKRSLTPGEEAAYRGEKDRMEECDNQYGHVLSCYNPVYNSQTKTIDAVLGADVSMDAVEKSFRNIIIRNCVLLTGVMLLIVIILVLYFKDKLVKPAATISKKMRDFTETHNAAETKIPFKSRDEFGQIAQSYNAMTDEIEEHIVDIRKLTQEKQKQLTELKIAADIQSDLLPQPYCVCNGVILHGSMNPAKNVGGDFYDYSEMPDGRLAVCIADVSGKGVSAALFMARTITVIRQFAQMGCSPKEILKGSNLNVCAYNANMMFVTVFMGIYDPKTRILTYSNAGHNLPYVVSDEVLPLNEAVSTAIGVFDDVEYENASIELKPGDTLFLYTDGLNEAVSSDKKFFGNERLVKTLQEIAPEERSSCIQKMQDVLHDFVGDEPQSDDVTMLSMTVGSRYEEKIMPEKKNLKRINEMILTDPYIPKKMRKKLCLVAEEIFVNICSYAFDGEGKPVQFIMEVNSKATLIFRDSGKPFDPIEEGRDTLDGYAPDEQIGGLGIYLTKAIAEECRYAYRDGQNELTVIIDLPPDEPTANGQ